MTTAQLPAPVRALIVDDQPDIRMLIRLILEACDLPCEVVGEAASGFEAVDLVDLTRPDCVVLDVMMPGIDGIETAARIRGKAPEQKVVFCSAHVARDDGRSVFGSDPFVSKDDVTELPEALRRLCRT